MRAFAFVLAILTAAALVGCQNRGQVGSAPSSGAESGVILEDQGLEGTQKGSDPAEMETASGVEVSFLASFPSPQQLTYPILRSADKTVRNGCLRVTVEDQRYSGSRDLLSFDLKTGEQVFALPLDDYRDVRYDLRQKGSGEFAIFTAEGCRRWDVLPERDLLAWCGPEGIWLAGSDGENPRLVLTTEAIGQQPEFPETVKEFLEIEGLEPWERVTFHSVRMMRDGQILSADFGSPQSQLGRLGHVVISLENGAASWYQPYFLGLPNSGELEYLDDTTILAGYTLIDTATGETSRAFRSDPEGAHAITGDFTHYYDVEQTDAQYRLFCYDVAHREEVRPILTLPRRLETAATDDAAYMRFYPMAAAGNKVVCYYQLPAEEGLMLVTVPEE